MSDPRENVGAIVKALGVKVRRAIESGGSIELITEAPTVFKFGERYHHTLPHITTLRITDWTPPSVPYDELVESWLERNQERLDEARETGRAV